MYHDVVDDGAEDSSGFVGRDAALYKVTPRQLDAHLDAIVESHTGTSPANGFVATFDDGGVTAMTAADALERRGLRGQFFVTVNYIGTDGFVTKADLIELDSRGHSVGSHSCSHPLRMGHCTWSQLVHEWVHSRAVLSDVLSHDVRIASVPGGDFAPRVARAAALAGYTKLFTSEPDRVLRHAYGLTLIGRFAVRRWTSAKTAAALAAGRFLPCAQQALLWNARKLTKRLGGEQYLRLRRFLLGDRDRAHWGDEPRR
jgi:peptidoglycan/xylan/chitin deacetylase (PgdA/CDA1 family)